MRKTLLKLTQDILTSIGSDEVNSISDSIESMTVANIIEQCYYDLCVELDLPEHETLFQLDASGDSAKPCMMTIPERILKCYNVRYDYRDDDETDPDWTIVKYLPFFDFINMQSSLRESDVEDYGSMNITLNGENFAVLYRKDRDPEYYTTVDDLTLIFNSIDNTKDSTLKKSKTMCQGTKYPAFEISDNFYPDLDSNVYPLLFNKAKTRAFNELKQMPNQESAAETRRQKIVTQARRDRTEDVPAVYSHARWGRKEQTVMTKNGQKSNRGW